jgi:outer membrane protein OmpA-like peptidoglycan-associated protein
MAYYSDDVFADSSVSLRRFLIPALLVSLALHGGLFYGLSKKTLENFTSSDKPRLVPRVFSVNRLQVDQKLLEPDGKSSNTSGSKTAEPGSIKNLNQFDSTFEDDMKEFRATPQVSTPEVPDLKEKPSVDTQARTAAAKAKAESALALEKELSDVRQKLMDDKPTVSTRPRLPNGNKNNPGKTDNQNAGDSAIAGNSGIPSGFSNLEELLSGSGKVGNGTSPILMPTDLLFDYDSANLRPGATSSLQKLGRLIQRNPQAVFRVEGHTDSFGSDQYNLDLSQRRAETVKTWLVENMGIDQGRIQTQGFGKARLLVPGDRSVEEQQLNRRVEIVIRSKG